MQYPSYHRSLNAPPWMLLRKSALILAFALLSTGALAQTASIIFEDDFSSDEIDPTRYEQAEPFFEGGKGNIMAEAGDGVMRFTGETTQQWWSGGTLRIKDQFDATEEVPVTLTIERVEEAGVGTASRSALWIFDETESNYILFADVRGEGGWRFNRKIGQPGDVKTGGGTNIGLFDGGDFDNGFEHDMKMVANGSTVRLFLDEIEGPEVPFPFSPVVFHFGAFARANNDIADTTWDNLMITGHRERINVLFEDNFDANQIDPVFYRTAHPSFENGQGNIMPTAANGSVQFTGTATQATWAGGTLQLLPSFMPSPSEKVTVAVDRVAEAGKDSASRSALWIFDESQTYYVLFADVRGDGGWRYNYRNERSEEHATGLGVDIPAFDGAAFDDGGLHRMSMITDGETVKLLLDGIEGPEIDFPFSPVTFHFGSAALAVGDNADTTWDNLIVQSEGKAQFNETDIGTLINSDSAPLTVRIPQGLNSQKTITVTIISDSPAKAEPQGGSNGRLKLTFPVGGANTQDFRVAGKTLGEATFTLESDDLNVGDPLTVAVVEGAKQLLSDAFTGNSVNASFWEENDQGFGAGLGTHQVEQTGGQLKIAGFTDTVNWAGASIKSAESYMAIADLNLVFEIDRVSVDPETGTGRTGVFLANEDRSRYVFFSQQVQEGQDTATWHVNVNPGSPTGNGTVVAAFSDQTEKDEYRLRLVADGSQVEVFLDGVSGGKFPFDVNSGIHLEAGVYGQNIDDFVTGIFDNALVQYALPCVAFDISETLLTVAETQEVTVTVPRLLNNIELQIDVASSNPAAAVPAGAVGDTLSLTYEQGGSNEQTFRIQPTGTGTATFSLTPIFAAIPENPPQCVGAPLQAVIIPVPEVYLSDNFSGDQVNEAWWTQSSFSFNNNGVAKEFPDSSISIVDGTLLIHVETELPTWPGLALFTQQTFSASTEEPLTFEIDRQAVDFVLAAGTSSESRTGIWVRSGDNYIFFVDHTTHNARDFGWRYNRSPGDSDNERIGDGINIAAFDGGSFDDQGDHRMKMVLNGTTANLYLDDVWGVELPFPYSENLIFGIGAYADDVGPPHPDTGVVQGNQTSGYFDNALITGGSGPTSSASITGFSLENGNLIIQWQGDTLKQSATVDDNYTPIENAVPPTTTVPVGEDNLFILATESIAPQ